MNLELKVILREIQLECQRQIGIERRSGRAIREEEIAPYPDRYDFDNDVQVVQSETQPQIEEKPSVTAIPGKTLAQLVEDTEATDKAESESKSQDPQMTVDEAISNAEKPEQPTSQSAQQECDVTRAPRSKFGAWFEAIRDWHFTRKEKEYRFECSKQRAEDRTYGFEYISNYIAHRIDELEKGN